MAPLEYVIFRILRLFRKLPVNPLSWASRKVYFLDFFKGFDNVAAVRGIFGNKTTEVLSELLVEFSWFNGYMYVDGSDGHIVISKNYLESGDRVDIYLDLIHELCHVKQFMEGRELFDPHFDYVDRPTEIEAYRYTVKEARRIGLTDKQIDCYLRTEWINEDAHRRLAKSVALQLPLSDNASL